MTMYLIECKNEECLETHISSFRYCPQCREDNVEVSTPTSEDYMIQWGQDLESANRHSLTDMPEQLHKILKDKVSEKILCEIFLEFWHNGIGV